MVREFSSPVETFKSNVTNVNDVIVDLKDKLQDLRNNSDRTMTMVRINKMLTVEFKFKITHNRI